LKFFGYDFIWKMWSRQVVNDDDPRASK
jgi:hypothetical protein